MLVEKTRREALEAYLKGRKIRVITEYDDGSMEVQAIRDLFPVADTHYLVDVPAVEKEEFKELGRTQAAHEAVGMEDRRPQDLLHELEFSKDENEKRRAGTKL